MNSQEMLDSLVSKIKKQVPGFEIRFQDQSKFMRFLHKIAFFNPSLKNYIITVGKTVYWSTEDKFKANPSSSFNTLAHELVHVMDYNNNPAGFMLGYFFPQWLAVFSLFAVLAVISPWFLLCLGFLLFLAPIPAIFRKNLELKGYGMSIAVRKWRGETNMENRLDYYADHFTGPAYYFMWPFRSYIKQKLREYVYTDECLKDRNPAYQIVHSIIMNARNS